MRTNYKYLLIVAFGLNLVLISCKQNDVFPKEKNLNELQATEFVPTLESSFSFKNNAIYAATMPLAWNEIRDEINSPIIAITNELLTDLNSTQGFKNALHPDEFKTTISIRGQTIESTAYFRKSLPFQEPLERFDSALRFNKQDVESFGFRGECEFARVNYYIDSNTYSISLLPKDENHEIILVMHQGKIDFTNFADYYNIYTDRCKTIRNESNTWRFYFTHEDKVQIPLIGFNLEHRYSNIEGAQFQANNQTFTITKAEQRNAFVLNENGAEVESFADIIVEAAEAPYEEKPEPKIMIFNKPFVVFLKRKNAEQPYFAVMINNTELLQIR